MGTAVSTFFLVCRIDLLFSGVQVTINQSMIINIKVDHLNGYL